MTTVTIWRANIFLPLKLKIFTRHHLPSETFTQMNKSEIGYDITLDQTTRTLIVYDADELPTKQREPPIFTE
jgi:hypothetical protein